MEGNLSQISLNDILLLATGSKKSGVLKLSRGKETVEVFFNDGEILHATCPIGEGEKALLYPVTWGEGSFNLLPPNGSVPPTTIHKNSGQILEEVKAMGREWETILELIPSSKTVVRIADLPEDQNGPITVPHVGWRVLSKIDGRHNVQEIAELLRVPYAYTAKVVFNLHKARLVEIVEPAKPASAIVPPIQLVRLGTILMDMIGPIAPVVLRDHIRNLEENEDSFPEGKLDELIGLLSREIADGRMRNKFEEQVLQEIANFKKF